MFGNVVVKALLTGRTGNVCSESLYAWTLQSLLKVKAHDEPIADRLSMVARS
jgi:hypothetical protein